MNTMPFHARIARAAAIALLVTGASMAHAGQISLGNATLDGDVIFDTTFVQGWWFDQSLTVNPAQIQVASTADTVGFSFVPELELPYSAGYQPNFDYGYGGSLDRLRGFTISGAPGYAVDLGQATVTVSGTVTLGDDASIGFWTGSEVLRQLNGPGTRYGKTTYDFSFTVAAGGQEPALGWGGNLPYAQGPNGTASTFSTVEMVIDRISFSAPVAAVPEVSSVGMALMGVLAVAGTVARRRLVQA